MITECTVSNYRRKIRTLKRDANNDNTGDDDNDDDCNADDSNGDYYYYYEDIINDDNNKISSAFSVNKRMKIKVFTSKV